MTVVGEAFVVIKSQLAADFTTSATRQVESAGGVIAGKLQTQFAQAGGESGQTFAAAVIAPMVAVADQFVAAGTTAGIGFAAGAAEISAALPAQFADAGIAAGSEFLAGTADVAVKLPEQFTQAGTEAGTGFAQGAAEVTAALPDQFAQAGAAAGQGFASNVQGPIVQSTSDVVVGLQDQFAQAGLLSGNAFVDRMTRGISAIGGPKAAATAAGVAIVGAVVAGFSTIGSEFGKVRKQITFETGATAAVVERLFDSVRDSVLTIPVSLGTAATAFDLLFKRGVPLGPLLDRLAAQQLTLARITGDELAPTVETTTALFAKFTIPVREQSRALDVLFKASQRSGKTLNDLVEPLLSGGAALQEFGFNLDESIALITQLNIAGVNVQPALASLRKAFASIVAEGGDPKQVLQDLIEQFKSGVDPAETMADAMKLFGSRAGLELATAIRSGKFELDDLLKIITNGKDGILATGAAALGLGDKFTLLRNRAQEALSGIGLAVRGALSSFVTDATGPVVQLAASIAHLLTEAAPLVKVFAPVGLLLQGILPAIGAFATGLDGIASVLSVLDNPVVLIAAGLATLTVAFAISAAGAHALAFAVRDLTVAFATNPYVLAATAIIAIGVAIQTFRKRADPAIAIAKKMSDAMFTLDDASSIFADGVATATQALDAFFTAQAKSKDANFIKGLLAGTGSTVAQLTTAVAGSTTAFEQFQVASLRALKAAGASSIEQIALSEALVDQREAFELTSRAQIQAAIDTGVLTRAQKNAIIEQNRFADGSVNFVGVLDEINGRLRESVNAHNETVLAMDATKTSTRELAEQLSRGEISATDAADAIEAMGLEGDAATEQLDKLRATAAILTAEQDKQALSTIETSKAYGLLATAIATGQISQVDATIALEEMGVSAEGAGQAFADLQTKVQTFIDGALSSLPSVATAVQAFESALSSDKSTLVSDVQRAGELQKEFAAAGGKASDELKQSIAENNAAIIADFKKLAEDQSPQKFTDQLLENARQITTFTGNLRTLVKAGLGSLAGDLAQLGPEQAGALAESLASNPSQAKVANAAAKLAEGATGSYKKFLEENIGPLALTGEAAGKAIGVGISKGIIAELVRQIPALKDYGIGAGTEIDKGAAEGVDTTTITDTMKAALAKHIPEFRGLGVPIGTEVTGGAKEGIDKTDLGAVIETAIRRGGGKVRGAGHDLGVAGGEGIAEGIRSQFDNVGNAVLAITQHGVAVAIENWKVFSPSRVFMDIGSQVGAGLVVGIQSGRDDVGRAAALLASDVTGSVDSALSGLSFDAVTPTITPTIAPIEIPVPTLPEIPPVVIGSTLEPPELPVVDPLVVSASFGPITPPVVPDVKPVEIGSLVTPPDPPTLPPVEPITIGSSFAPPSPPALPAVDPLVLSARFGPIDVTDAARLVASEVSTSVSEALGSVSLAGIDLETAEPIGQRFGSTIAEGIDRAGVDVTDSATRLADTVRDTLSRVGDDETPGQRLVDGFSASFDTITDKATQLSRFLLALGGTKFAPIQPPSDLSIREAGQSLQVARPQDRANAQGPGLVGRSPFDGATLVFPERTTPLHIAAELAWRADMQTSIGS